jgi:hypothetical protein
MVVVVVMVVGRGLGDKLKNLQTRNESCEGCHNHRPVISNGILAKACMRRGSLLAYMSVLRQRWARKLSAIALIFDCSMPQEERLKSETSLVTNEKREWIANHGRNESRK